jgi:hypothetical protein
MPADSRTLPADLRVLFAGPHSLQADFCALFTDPQQLSADLRALLALVERKLCADITGIKQKIAQHRMHIVVYDIWIPGSEYHHELCSLQTQILLLKREYTFAQYRALWMLRQLRFMSL